MATRQPDATRRRIFEAATDEFATHGIAGARVDRIAAAANVSKGLIYAHFDSKQALFDAVTSEHARRVLAIPFDATDLPGVAVALFDFYVADPDLARIATWYALERGEDEPRSEAIQKALDDRVRAVEEAQERGLVDRHLDAAHIVTLLAAVARAWTVPMPESGGGPQDTRVLAGRRAAVRETVRRLVEPSS